MKTAVTTAAVVGAAVVGAAVVGAAEMEDERSKWLKPGRGGGSRGGSKCEGGGGRDGLVIKWV
jgi:Spy/CpxP family protein refolding chaperone